MKEDEETLQQLSKSKRFIYNVVKTVAPYKKKDIQVRSGDNVDYANWGEEDVKRYSDAYSCKPPPFMIPLITLVEIAVFCYYTYKLNSDNNPSNDVTTRTGIFLRSPLVFSPFRRVEAWRFVSYMFMHQGYIHLIFNCIMQLILGNILELVHKFWRVGIVYMLGVLAGSLAHSCFDSTKYLVGASGGCYALIGAHFATVLMNWDTMQKGWCSNPINFISSGVFCLLVIFLLAVSDTGMAIYNRFSSDIPNNISFSAHIGGALAGVLVGVPVLRNLEVMKWEKVCFWICLVVYCAFMISAIIFNGICAPKFCYETNWNNP